MSRLHVTACRASLEQYQCTWSWQLGATCTASLLGHGGAKSEPNAHEAQAEEKANSKATAVFEHFDGHLGNRAPVVNRAGGRGQAAAATQSRSHGGSKLFASACKAMTQGCNQPIISGQAFGYDANSGTMLQGELLRVLQYLVGMLSTGQRHTGSTIQALHDSYICTST